MGYILSEKWACLVQARGLPRHLSLPPLRRYKEAFDFASVIHWPALSPHCTEMSG